MTEVRTTPQRRAVREALAAADEFVSAQELHDRVRAGGVQVGLATVYRALAGFADSGEADVMQSPEGETLYRACVTTGHHHHLVCRVCGSTRELSAQVVEEWTNRVGQDHGFTEVSHVVDLAGICADCTARRAQNDAAS